MTENLIKEYEGKLYVIVCRDKYGSVKYVSTKYPQLFSYTNKLNYAKTFHHKQNAEDFAKDNYMDVLRIDTVINSLKVEDYIPEEDHKIYVVVRLLYDENNNYYEDQMIIPRYYNNFKEANFVANVLTDSKSPYKYSVQELNPSSLTLKEECALELEKYSNNI